jgi:hypothetical protein
MTCFWFNRHRILMIAGSGMLYLKDSGLWRADLFFQKLAIQSWACCGTEKKSDGSWERATVKQSYTATHERRRVTVARTVITCLLANHRHQVPVSFCAKRFVRHNLPRLSPCSRSGAYTITQRPHLHSATQYCAVSGNWFCFYILATK